MKKITVCLLAFLFTLSMSAQNKLKEAQAGLFAESQILSSSPYIWDRGFGALYRYSNKSNKAMRFQLVYKNKGYNEGTTLFSLKNDTIKETKLERADNNFYIGVGIEKQRHFYKKVYLYAAVDARFGYGISRYNLNTEYKAYDKNSGSFVNYYLESSASPMGERARHYMLDILPSIGAKIDGKKMGLTLEMGLNLQNAYSTYVTLAKSGSMYELSLIGFLNRLGFYYKF